MRWTDGQMDRQMDRMIPILPKTLEGGGMGGGVIFDQVGSYRI